jgi:nicotinamidase-related amidase
MSTALLIIDIQNDYFSNGTMPLVNSEQASMKAKQILEKFRQNNGIIVHVQHIALRPEATFFLPNTPGCEIHRAVKPLYSEKVIVKHYPNSFRETELSDYLKSKRVTSLVICGMMTHMCIDATTRAAKDSGFSCTLIGDACATRNLEIDGQIIKARDVHYGFLAALNHTYAEITTTERYLNNPQQIA